MQKLPLLLFVICLTIFSCSKDESNREEEQARLDKMYQEIIDYSLVNSKPCTNPDEWALMRLGASNCSGFILYNKSIDVAVFQKKIDQYLNARGKFDAKWGVVYDCVTLPPTVVIKCIDSKAQLSYDAFSN